MPACAFVQRGSQRRRTGLAALAAVAAAGALPVLLLPGSLRQAPVRLNAEDTDGGGESGSALNSLEGALTQVQPLASQVQSGRLVPDFGQKAATITAGVASSVSPELKAAVEGVLEALFHQQLAILRQQVSKHYVESPVGVGTLQQADRDFTEEAEKLVKPGSGWSYQVEREALQRGLGGTLHRDAMLLQERAQAARAQQATIAVIGKLQSGMEMLQQKVQGVRGGGSPWVLSSSYRIPNTPLQVVGKYEQGRANLELNLTPDKDPSGTDGGFSQSIGPANIGVSFDLGL